MSDVEKIVIHYKNGEKKTLKKGFAGWLERGEKDLMIDFARIEEKEARAIVSALHFSLVEALNNKPK